MKFSLFSSSKKMLHLGFIVLGIAIFSKAGLEQLNKIERNKQQLSSCAEEEYFALFFHYRTTVNQLLFANEEQNVINFTAQLHLLLREMAQFESNVSLQTMTINEYQNFQKVIQMKRRYVSQVEASVVEVQENCTETLYCKETKLGVILFIFAILFTINPSRRLKYFVIRRLLHVSSRSHTMPKFALH